MHSPSIGSTCDIECMKVGRGIERKIRTDGDVDSATHRQQMSAFGRNGSECLMDERCCTNHTTIIVLQITCPHHANHVKEGCPTRLARKVPLIDRPIPAIIMWRAHSKSSYPFSNISRFRDVRSETRHEGILAHFDPIPSMKEFWLTSIQYQA
jgi:hypothetical protein